jgi:predicted metal-dependent HD superfamily phosphohydrolase
MDTDRTASADPLDATVEFLTPELRADLLERWNEPQRCYHNETHLRAVLRAVDALEADGEPFDATEVRLAAWLHAAVLDPTESENNAKSAAFAETYDTYAADVRHEFAHVPGERFAAGRIAALEGLLERRSVYLSRAGRDRWEKQAHANLNRELGLLRSGAATH